MGHISIVHGEQGAGQKMHPAWAPCLDVFTLHYLDRHHHHHHDDVDHVQYTLSISQLCS